MKIKTEHIIIGAVGLLLLLIPNQLRASSFFAITDWLIPEFESFRATPYWDVKRYSWGFGTRAPGSAGTITRDQALQEMREYVMSDYNYLSSLITRPLTAHQWAAYLDFSYNLGRGNADNLVNNINSYNDEALQHQWLSYVNVDGIPNDDLMERRSIEWDIWNGRI